MFSSGLTDSVERRNKRPTDAFNRWREHRKVLDRLHRENMERMSRNGNNRIAMTPV
jgi:hypothetical protein